MWIDQSCVLMRLQRTLLCVFFVTNIALLLFICLYWSTPCENDGLLHEGLFSYFSGPSLQTKMYPSFHECSSHFRGTEYTMRGDYYVLNNYIFATEKFACNETVTYTTHGDYTFLHNLIYLSSRWQGPISVAVYAPKDDFQLTVQTIVFLRHCYEDVRKYVSFHIFFETNYMPIKVPSAEELFNRSCLSCQWEPEVRETYRIKHGIKYPVNVARNIARLNADTYFLLASDIELFPSADFIPQFLDMLNRPDFSTTEKPRVYTLPIFEVKEGVLPPKDKTELQIMLLKKKAVTFHKHVCEMCHLFPHYPSWKRRRQKSGLSVLAISNRVFPHAKWEPIYLGTHDEPLYDDRLSWEGRSDKMTQMYILCLKRYEFHILDNAFLVHKPGIKLLNKSHVNNTDVTAQTKFITEHIANEYEVLYGQNKRCTLM